MGRRQHAQTADVARSRVAALGAGAATRRGPVARGRAAVRPQAPVGLASPPAQREPSADWPDEVDQPDRPERSEQRGLARYLPAVIRDADLGMGSRSLRTLMAVAALVALVAGIAAWRTRPDAEPVAAPPVVAASASASPAQTVVAVSGRVRRPGLVRLPAGARVADALQAVGGALPGTDLSTLNLARKVVDGELITVGAAPPAGGTSTAAPGADPNQPLDLNTATADQFDDLPGVGPVLAQNIVAYRTAHGSFRSVDELRQVDGIGDSRYEHLKDLVRV